MSFPVARKNFLFLQIIIIIHLLTSNKIEAFLTSYSESWKMLNELVESNNNAINYPILKPSYSRPQQINQALSKVVFPVPEDVVMNRSYLPDLGFLTDLAFLFFLPRNLPVSGMIRLSRDLFESEQCVQFVGCEMTKVAQRHSYMEWINNLLQDFPFQGDVADRLRQGSMDAIRKFNKRKTMVEGNGATSKEGNNNNNANRKYRRQDLGGEDGCTFSCNPITSLSKGLKILSLLHDLVRTVR